MLRHFDLNYKAGSWVLTPLWKGKENIVVPSPRGQTHHKYPLTHSFHDLLHPRQVWTKGTNMAETVGVTGPRCAMFHPRTSSFFRDPSMGFGAPITYHFLPLYPCCVPITDKVYISAPWRRTQTCDLLWPRAHGQKWRCASFKPLLSPWEEYSPASSLVPGGGWEIEQSCSSSFPDLKSRASQQSPAGMNKPLTNPQTEGAAQCRWGSCPQA